MYGVIEVQAVPLLPRIEVHLRISFVASCLDFKMSKITTSSLVDNTFTIFALNCLFEHFEEKAAFRCEELDALVVLICCANYKTASGE